MQTFAIARDKFRDTIESIDDRMSKWVETKKRSTAHDKMALQILENEKWSQLAKILVDGDDIWIKSVIDNFSQAHDDLMKCWLDKDQVHFDIRLSALRMTYICELYKKLFIDKNLRNLKTERYFAYILPALVKCMENRNKKNSIERYMEIKLFAVDILRFTKVESTAEFVQQAINELLAGETDKKLEWKQANTNSIIEWVDRLRRDEPLLKHSMTVIAGEPLVTSQNKQASIDRQPSIVAKQGIHGDISYERVTGGKITMIGVQMPESAMSHYNASTQGIFGKINFCDIQGDGEISHIGVKITENERNQLVIAEIMPQLNDIAQSIETMVENRMNTP
jgi:hypothetical protein